MSMITCVTFSPDAKSCRRAAAGISAKTRCSAPWACCNPADAVIPASCREPATKPVGKPDAGNPHVRFDERGGETDCLRGTAPLLDSTVRQLASFALDSFFLAGRATSSQGGPMLGAIAASRPAIGACTCGRNDCARVLVDH